MSTTTVRQLQRPIAAALLSAQAELAATAEGSAEIWVLPEGDVDLPGPLALGTGAHALTLRGQEGTSARVHGGALVIVGSAVTIASLALRIDQVDAGIEISAGAVTLTDLELSATVTEPATILSVDAAGGPVRIDQVTVNGAAAPSGLVVSVRCDALFATGVRLRQLRASAGDVRGLEVVCREAQLSDVAVEDATATGRAVAIEVAAQQRIEATDVRCADLRSQGVVAMRLLSSGMAEGVETAEVDSADARGISAIDVVVTNIDGGAGEASGVVAGTAGRLRARGLTVAGIRGDQVTGVLAFGAAGVEVAMAHVEDVVGTAAAAGVRVIASPSEAAATVRDVAVSRIAGPPPAQARPAAGWRQWSADASTVLSAAPLGPLELPPLPGIGSADVVGLQVSAYVDALSPLLDGDGPGAVVVEDCSIRTITGAALQIEAGLRASRVRRTEAWTSVHAGWLQAEQLLMAQLTWHRHGSGLRIGPGEVHAYDALFSAIAGAPLLLETDADLTEAHALFSDGSHPSFLALGALPYRVPGPAELPAQVLAGALPPPLPDDEDVDLRLVPGTLLAARAVRVPGDGAGDPPPFIGAWEPDAEPLCELQDPQPRPYTRAPPPPPAGALVDYRARDAKSLLQVMLDRARVTMPSWTDRGPADFTTMIFEAVAAQLDYLGYRQERSVGEGFLVDARLRRSVEDHARALDYTPDPGLSATAMLRFRIAPEVLARRVEARLLAEGLTSLPERTTALELINGNRPLEIPEGTLVANATNTEPVLVFGTEAPLTWFERLDELLLDEPVREGDTSATLAGRFPELEPNRWLVLTAGHLPPHVIRVTRVEVSTETTWIAWDPRRPATATYPGREEHDPALRARLLGNVIPAHHGLPITPSGTSALPEALGEFEALVGRWRQLLQLQVDGASTREVPLPFHPISVQARGYPFPGEERTRRGEPQLRVTVEGDEWRRVEDLSVHGPSDEVVVLRASSSGAQSLRFGDGFSGAALPARPTEVAVSIAIGLGSKATVTAGTLTRIIHVPGDGDRPLPPGGILSTDADEMRALLTVDNPLPTVGGRDPEPLDRIRYRAPLRVAKAQSAISTSDYVTLLEQLPEVAGVFARAFTREVRSVIRCTVLLRDSDTLDSDEMLRRWAQVRRRLEEIRLLGFDVEAIPPVWIPLDLDLDVDAASYAQPDLLRDAVVAAIGGNGGLLDPDRTGLGGDVQLASLYQAVLAVEGVTAVRVKRFRRLAPRAPEQLSEGVIPIGPEEVATIAGGLRPGSKGLLTVTVCGGMR